MLTLSRHATYIYICRALSPLNSQMATKVAGGWGFNSGVKDLILARQRVNIRIRLNLEAMCVGKFTVS